MNHKILIAAIAVAMGGAAYADDTTKPAYQETPEGDPQVLQQGPSGAPVHSQVRELEGSPEIARQGQEGGPASAEPNFQLGPKHIDQAGTEVRERPETTNAFYSMDQDADGYLSQQEADESLRTQWNDVDRDANGKVDEAEFSAFEATREEQPPVQQYGDPENSPRMEPQEGEIIER